MDITCKPNITFIATWSLWYRCVLHVLIDLLPPSAISVRLPSKLSKKKLTNIIGMSSNIYIHNVKLTYYEIAFLDGPHDSNLVS
jgi:hypothetical protein